MSQDLYLWQLHENPANPRKTFDAAQLEQLADSIKSHGLLQPLVVRPLAVDPGQTAAFEIVCGHRRARAARLAEQTTVPCIVRELTDREALEAMVVENSQRQDVAPLEEAEAFGALRAAGATAAEIAGRIGRPTRFVLDRLALLELIEPLRDHLAAGRLPLTGAFALARLPRPRQEQVYGKADDYNALAYNLRPLYVAQGRPVTVQAVMSAIARSSHALSRAPWPMDEIGIGGAPACEGCMHRTSSQPDLWGTETTDQCLEPSCWSIKADAWFKAQASAGVQTLDRRPNPREWVEADARAWPLKAFGNLYSGEGEQVPAWRQVVPDLRTSLAPGYDGGFEEFLELAAIERELREQGQIVEADAVTKWLRPVAEDVAEDQERKRIEREQEQAREAQLDAAILTIVEAVEDNPEGLDVTAKALAQLATHAATLEALLAVARRRGWVKPKGCVPSIESRIWLETLAGKLSVQGRIALFVELLVQTARYRETSATSFQGAIALALSALGEDEDDGAQLDLEHLACTEG